jgi:hypothetical protein
MHKKFTPSPAFILAFVALLVALGGSAVAGVPAKVARAISGTTIKKHSISGVRLENNTLTGKQIAESKLSIVPKSKRTIFAHNAGSAGTAINSGAVGGLAVHKIDFAAAEGTNPSTILAAQGLTLSASCSGAGNPVLSASSGANDSDIRISVVQSTTTKSGANTTRVTADSNFDAGNTINATVGAPRGNGTLAFASAAGKIVHVSYSFHGAPSLGASKSCLFTGVSFDG